MLCVRFWEAIKVVRGVCGGVRLCGGVGVAVCMYPMC
jgi:hypothetical protein